jgi:hypothetical protein
MPVYKFPDDRSKHRPEYKDLTEYKRGCFFMIGYFMVVAIIVIAYAIYRSNGV